MNEHHEHSEHEEVSKLLKKLPKVDATPDFEFALQRKIDDSSREKEGKRIFIRLLFIQRAPVFVSSIIALLAVGIISYYVFQRGETTTQSDQHVSASPKESYAAAQPDKGSEVNGQATSVNKKDEVAPQSSKQMESSTNEGVHNQAQTKRELPSYSPNMRRNEPQPNDADASKQMNAVQQMDNAPVEAKAKKAEGLDELNQNTRTIDEQAHPVSQEVQQASPLINNEQGAANAIQQHETKPATQMEMSVAPVQGSQITGGADSQKDNIPNTIKSAIGKARKTTNAYHFSPTDTSKADSLRRDSLLQLMKRKKP